MKGRYHTILVATIALMTVVGVGMVPVAAQEETPTETPIEDGTPTEEEATPTEEEATATEEEGTPADGGEAAAVTFENGTSNGSAVTVDSVTLPEGGFVLVYTVDQTIFQDDAAMAPDTEEEASPTEEATEENDTEAEAGTNETEAGAEETAEDASPTEAAAVVQENATETETAVNETETPTETEAAEDETEEATETETGTPTATPPASLGTGGPNVTSLTEVNASTLGLLVGNTSYLEAGTHEDVTVQFNGEMVEDQVLIAVAYQDVNENQAFDGLEIEAPYVDDQGQIVADWAYVTLGEMEAGETPTEEDAMATEENATATEEDGIVDEETETETEEEATPTEEGESPTEADGSPTEEAGTETELPTFTESPTV